MKIVNIEALNYILKVAKKQGFRIYLENTYLTKPYGGWVKLIPPTFLGLKEMNKTKLYVHYKIC